MPKPNTILIGECVYTMTSAYIAGAKAMRRNLTYHANPYRDNTQTYSDWNDGHCHEAAGEHRRFGLDLLEQPPTGQEFGEDPNLVRDEYGDVLPQSAQSGG